MELVRPDKAQRGGGKAPSSGKLHLGQPRCGGVHGHGGQLEEGFGSRRHEERPLRRHAVP